MEARRINPAILDHVGEPSQGGGVVREIAEAIAETIGTAALETLWPTRCAVCDAPGELLCNACRAELPFIDLWRACPKCGAPFGSIQCTECCEVMLAEIGRTELPFTAAIQALTLDDRTHRLISVYKDRGERRLAEVIARIIADYLPPEWPERAEAFVWIPATSAAERRRGFDHAELIAEALARELGLPAISLFARPKSRDQRLLSSRERLENMHDCLHLLPDVSPPRSLILMDDVYTTGATMLAACDALSEGGAEEVFCLNAIRTNASYR